MDLSEDWPSEAPSDSMTTRVPVARPVGSKGTRIRLLTNHFEVKVRSNNGYFYLYRVSLFHEDGTPVVGKGVGRKIIEEVWSQNEKELRGNDFAYDGEKALFTRWALSKNKLEFTVVLEGNSSNEYRIPGNGGPGNDETHERRQMHPPYQLRIFKAELNFASKISMQAIGNALRGQELENSPEALRVLDIVLRQHAAQQGRLLVRQSFFRIEPINFFDIGGGVHGCRGFHSSLRVSQGGLSLNIDVSTTTIIKPGPVRNFLLANQEVSRLDEIDWAKAKQVLKNLRVKVYTGAEYKIVGLSDLPCHRQSFVFKERNGNGNGEPATRMMTVLEYFTGIKKIPLEYSANYPCINVGKPNKPTYIPIEFCDLVSLQRYTKALSALQRSSLVEESLKTPQQRMRVLSDALKSSNYYADETMLRASGGVLSINTNFTEVDARVLPAPKLRAGNGKDLLPNGGCWRFHKKKKLVQPTKIERWAIVAFSEKHNLGRIWKDLQHCGRQIGMEIANPSNVFVEETDDSSDSPTCRVDNMFENLEERLRNTLQFILCLLPEKKNSDLYGPWKRKCLSEFGIVTQCIAPPHKANYQYLTNVLLKINAKLGGINSLLAVEHSSAIPVVSSVPTLILGMDVSHGSPGQSDFPSIAAVVSSRQWPLISRYRAFVRTQSPKVEMIESLFKPVGDNDEGLIREAVLDFCTSSLSHAKPSNIIIFRDSVGESQFDQVLKFELNQIFKACQFLDPYWCPKFTVIIAQKKPRTRFFQLDSPDNVPPGTVHDTKICHPCRYDFYMCAQAGMIGTTRPTHYHVLLDEIDFPADDLQALVHYLSHVCQRSKTAISVVAPIRYAHLAAAQMSQLLKVEDMSDTSSGDGGPSLPELHENVSKSMFFC